MLRSLELSDIDDIMPHFNNLEYRRTIGGVLPMTTEQENDWIKSTWESRSKGEEYHFAFTTHDGKFLGTVGLFDINKTWKNAEVGIGIPDPNNRNRGYGTDAVITMCAFGFLHLNLHMICLKYVEYNKNGARSYQKAGFTETGREREALFRDGKYHDFIRMDILDREFFEKFSEYTLYKPSGLENDQ